MKTRLLQIFRLILVLAVVFSSSPAALAANQASPAENTPDSQAEVRSPAVAGVIAGQVKTAEGTPLQGVMIKATLNTGNVLVLDEAGDPVSGAQVYDQTNLLGVTNAQGVLIAPNLQNGARLAARLKISETPSLKYAHDLNALQNWAYRTYITSLDIPQSAEPLGLLVTSPNLTQTLTIKKSNTLIGFNLLVSVEWDADSAYLDDLKLAFENASAYLYDASDGQMVFEQVSLYDDSANAADADFFFQANNQVLPRSANASLRLASGRVNLGRAFNRFSADSGKWSEPDGYRTLVYHFAQYGFGLFDESYGYDLNQRRTNTACTSTQITSNISDTLNASLMYWRYNASEFGMRNVAGMWSTECESSLQFQKLAQSDWETLRDLFQEPEPARWQFLTPQDRGGVVAGPLTAAMPSWSLVSLAVDANTGICTSPLSYQVRDENGSPVSGAEVLLTKVNNRGSIPQGKTNSLGQIEILGAINTDMLIVNAWRGQFRSGTTQIACSILKPANPEVLPAITIQPHTFSLTSTVLPGPGAQDVTIIITTSIPLTTPVSVIFSQEGEINAMPVSPPQVASNVWETSLSMSPLLAAAGTISVQADQFGEINDLIRNFRFEDISAATEEIVRSQDGLVELTLAANAGPSSGKILVHSNQVVITTTNELSLLSGPYTIQTAAGYSLPASANLAISYHDPGGLLASLDRQKIYIARWNGQAWSLLSSKQFSTTDQTVSTLISQPGVYGLVIKPLTYLYLPMVTVRSAAGALDLEANKAELAVLPYAPLDLSGIQSSVVYSMATDASGYFTFTNIPTGEYLVTAIQPGFNFSPANRIVPPDGAVGQDFSRQAGAPLQGESVFVASGSFLMGCDPAHAGGANCATDTKPLHTVFLSPYFLGKYEVDNGRYAACVTGGGCSAPADTTYYGQPQYTNYPVIKVTWKQAGEYCAWAGGSLPTEAQWEKAARGPTPRAFPWGDTTPNCSLANYSGCLGHTSPITATLGVSPYNAFNMAGNVAEWVYDVFDPLYYASSPYYNPTGPALVGINQAHAIRGGSYLNGTSSLVTSYRLSSIPNFPTISYAHIGFRCQFAVP